MKILMLPDFYPPFIGGVQIAVQSLSRELSKRGHKIIVGTMGRRDLPNYEEDEGVRIYRLEGLFQKISFLFKNPAKKQPPPARDWLISQRLAEIIKRERPDIIHTHGWLLYSALPCKRQFKIPLVHTLHDYRLFCPNATLLKDNAMCDSPGLKSCLPCMRQSLGWLKGLATYWGVMVNRKGLESVDRFIAISAIVKETYQKYMGMRGEEILLIPNFHSTDISKAEQGVSGFPDDFILFAGWMMPHKGIDILIEAYQTLNTKTKLLILGIEHPDYLYRSTERICIIKNAPHDLVMAAMSRCRFLVIPSICPDTAPLVTREAMSQGKAVIGSNIGGIKEAVVDGTTGILVPPNNSEKLAEAIFYLLERPDIASEMGRKGYERFRENYTADVVIPRILQVYENLLRG